MMTIDLALFGGDPVLKEREKGRERGWKEAKEGKGMLRSRRIRRRFSISSSSFPWTKNVFPVDSGQALPPSSRCRYPVSPTPSSRYAWICESCATILHISVPKMALMLSTWASMRFVFFYDMFAKGEDSIGNRSSWLSFLNRNSANVLCTLKVA